MLRHMISPWTAFEGPYRNLCQPKDESVDMTSAGGKQMPPSISNIGPSGNMLSACRRLSLEPRFDWDTSEGSNQCLYFPFSIGLVKWNESVFWGRRSRAKLFHGNQEIIIELSGSLFFLSHKITTMEIPVSHYWIILFRYPPLRSVFCPPLLPLNNEPKTQLTSSCYAKAELSICIWN